MADDLPSRIVVLPPTPPAVLPSPGTSVDAGAAGWRAAGQSPADLGGLFSAVLRRWRVFLCVFALCVSGALVVVQGLQPTYRSEATLLVDTRRLHYADVRAVLDAPSQSSDLNWVRSEQQVLGNSGLARRVIEALRLQDNPDFQTGPSAIGRALIWSGLRPSPPSPDREQAMEAAIDRYRQLLGIFNDGKSFVISVSFTAGSPTLARRILEEHIKTYLADQKAVKEAAILRAEGWLQGELKRLEAKVEQSEQRTQRYREDNRLLRSGGETLVGRQLADVAGQLSQARADLARRSARAGEIAGGAQDTDALASELLQRLRQQEATLAQQVASLEPRHGQDSPSLVMARAALADVRRKIAVEVARFRTSIGSDVAIARTRVAELERQVQALERQATVGNRAELEARQLDRETEADRRLYADLLARSKEVAIQREIQEADARLISAPSVPVQPAFPRRGLLMAVAACAAAVLAGAAALLRDRLAGEGVQSLEGLELVTGLPGLGIVPRMSRVRPGQLVPAPRPLSQSAAALNALANSILFQMPDAAGRLVVVASALPGEGKSVLCGLLAQAMAQAELRVLLVDADTRRRGLSRMVGGPARPGLVDLLEGDRTFPDAVAHRALGGVDVLLAGRECANPHGLFRRARLKEVLEEARRAYDVVLVDTPPLAAVDDCLPIAGQADATVLVARWGRSPPAALSAAQRRLRLAGARIIGSVLTCADVSRGWTTGRRDLEAFRPFAGAYFRGRT